MSAVQFAFMNNQMAQMMHEMRSEFSGDNDEQNTVGPEMYNDDTSDDEMSDTARSQSISAKLNRLTLEEGASSSSRFAPNHGSSSTAGKADESSRHFIIPGDYTEVNNNYYQIDFDSHKVENNIIVNSFGEGEQGDIGV
jgi:hypothetical protein